MATSIKAPVSSAVLIWARETAGYSIEDAAHKIGITAEKLAAVEANDQQLTFAQLKKAADTYKRPLATLFLAAPPPRPEPIHDFRLGAEFAHRALSPRLNVAIRNAREHREEALQLATEIGEQFPDFEHAAAMTESPDAVATRIRAILGISIETQLRWNDNRIALREWKRAVESLPVLIFETSRIEVEEMRGASLPFDRLPVVVLNGADSLAGRIFTLLHELTHLLMRAGGVCDLVQVDDTTSDARVEAFCNAVAGAALVPADTLRIKAQVDRPLGWTMAQLDDLGQAFSVSKEVVLRRLLTLGLTTPAHYARMREEFVREYRELRQQRRESTGGPEPAVMTLRNLGRPFVRLVLDAYADDRISMSAVSSYLGLKLKHLPRIEDLARREELAA